MPPEPSITQLEIEKYREVTYQYLPHLKLKSESEAIQFVNERKFIFFWPISGLPLPSLWAATAGNRPVPNNHDDPGHITWRWKDALLDKKVWYYAEILRSKSTIISLELVDHFIALSNTASQGMGELEYLFRIGKCSRLELEIFSLLTQFGPLDAISLKQRASRTHSFSSGEYDRAMLCLQRQFNILPTGISENGRWHYSFLYDTLEHCYPQKLNVAAQITKHLAREKILTAIIFSNGVSTIAEMKKLLDWELVDIQHTLDALQLAGKIIPVQKAQDSQSAFAISDWFNKK
jgi:hypothetical protein